MGEGLTRAQQERQREIMRCLIEEPNAYRRQCWWPSAELVARVQIVMNCSPQAAAGALRSLVGCGLVRRDDRIGQGWCRATDAAFRASALSPQTKEKGE